MHLPGAHHLAFRLSLTNSAYRCREPRAETVSTLFMLNPFDRAILATSATGSVIGLLLPRSFLEIAFIDRESLKDRTMKREAIRQSSSTNRR